MSNDNQFVDLLKRVRMGDAQAAEDLVRRYESAIRREVRFRLRDSRLRRIADASDICQMVLGSFFARAALGQFEITTPAELLNLLMQIARNKLADEIRREHADRRGGTARAEPLQDRDGEVRPVPSAEPSPSVFIANQDLVSHLLKRMTAEERKVCELRHAGAEWPEIAAQLGEDAEALRKRYKRAIDRVANEVKLDSLQLA